MRYSFLALFALASWASLTPTGFCSEPPAESEVVVTMKPKSEGKSRSLILEIGYPKGAVFNTEAPWKLEFSGNLSQVLGLSQKTFGVKFLDVPGSRFVIPVASVPRTKETGEYHLTLFLCDKAKTWCTRLMKDGTFSWQATGN